MEIRDRLGNLLYSTQDDSRPCRLDGLNLQNADLQGVNMPVYLDNADLSLSDLRGANFYWGTLMNVRFDGANLGPSGFGVGTSIRGCDFTGANLDGAVLAEAFYDEGTRFPEGFTPALHGMVFWSESEKSTPPSP